MTKIKVFDAVMTPDGVGEVAKVQKDSVNVFVAGEASSISFPIDALTLLVPDTGLEERVRALADEWSMDPERVLGPYEELLAILDTPEAEPEVWTCKGCHYMNSGSVCTKCALPKPTPPPAAVTHDLHQYLLLEMEGLRQRMSRLERAWDEVLDAKPTLRDQLAMAALTGLLAERCGIFDTEAFAADAYLYADAMLAARLRGEEEG